MSKQIYKNGFQCDFKKWSTFGGNLAKLDHFSGPCQSGSNPKNKCFSSIFKSPWSKWESNNCLGTSFKTKEFADTLQKWSNLKEEDKTDEKWVQLFATYFFECH